MRRRALRESGGEASRVDQEGRLAYLPSYFAVMPTHVSMRQASSCPSFPQKRLRRFTWESVYAIVTAVRLCRLNAALDGGCSAVRAERSTGTWRQGIWDGITEQAVRTRELGSSDQVSRLQARYRSGENRETRDRGWFSVSALVRYVPSRGVETERGFAQRDRRAHSRWPVHTRGGEPFTRSGPQCLLCAKKLAGAGRVESLSDGGALGLTVTVTRPHRLGEQVANLYGKNVRLQWPTFLPCAFHVPKCTCRPCQPTGRRRQKRRRRFEMSIYRCDCSVRRSLEGPEMILGYLRFVVGLAAARLLFLQREASNGLV